MRFKGYAYTVVGSRRTNQDAFLLADEKRLYAVADGVGGGLCGDVAARMAIDALKVHVREQRELRACFLKAHEEIVREALESFGEPLMGTTLTAILLEDHKVYLCHAGDSRLYHIKKGSLVQLSTDHEEYEKSFQANVLDSYLGMSSKNHPLQIQESEQAVEPGDAFLLCTDGLHRQVAHGRLTELITSHELDPQTLVETLCLEAASSPYSDNVTVLYVQSITD
ncbi:MAG: serine/threonine-protein phosphatase [Deltaproteobacteria bacterium]|nr:serine/threonine-protein phosphatase [Deltaproteobacteria bacterium]